MTKSKFIILLFLNLKAGGLVSMGSSDSGYEGADPKFMREAKKRRLEKERLEKEKLEKKDPNYKEEENKKQKRESWEEKERSNPWFDRKEPFSNNNITDMITSIKNLIDYK